MPLYRNGDRGACGSMFGKRMGGKVILNRFTPNVVGGKMQLNRYRTNHYGCIERGKTPEKAMAIIGGGNEGGANGQAGTIHSQAYASGPTLKTVTGVSDAMPNQASVKEMRKRTLAAIDKALKSGPNHPKEKRQRRGEQDEHLVDTMEV